MAVDRNRLAAALAYEEERRRRMMESVPTTDNLPPVQPSRRSLRTDLENFSAGLGQAGVNALEGTKALITDPVGTVKGTYESVRQMVRDPSLIADALRYTADKAMSGPLGAGEVIGEMVNPMRMRGKGPMAEIDVYHGSPHRFEPEETLTVYRGENTANKGGNYWTGDPEFARQFTQSGLENEIKRSTLSSADVYTPPTPVFAGDAKAVDAAIAEARRLGKSAVRFSEGKGQPDSFYVVEKTALGRIGNPLGAFNASKIGTGEGAQAYGHGIYLAESPDVAKTYQSAQSPLARKATMTLQASDGNVNKAIAAMKKEVATMTAHKDSPYLRQGAFQETQDALNYLQQMKKGAAPQTGALYTADLPDEMVDRMLDWDKPLSEQPESVRKAVQQINAEFAVPYAKLDEPLGFYVGKLGDAVGGHANASKLMASYGVPGIRYLDAGSRLQGGSGTRNFVVFPGEEKKVKILKRE